MDPIYLLLRFIHVITTIIWAGFAIMLALYINPAVNSLGADGGKFMQALARTRKFPAFMSALSGLAILSGILLYIKISVPGMMSTKFGIMLTIGAVSGIAAFIVGSTINLPSIKKISKIGEEIAKAGAPTAEQSQELMRLKNKIGFGVKLIAILISIAVIFMSMSKYI